MALLDLIPKSKIEVTVDEILADIIVVSFQYKTALYQGVLLDTQKKLLPCGIKQPAHVPPPLGTAPAVDEKLQSVSQRYTYFQENVNPVPSARPPTKVKTARMTVRLRPRQVLCSKCRGICNENSENVDVSSKKRKRDEVDAPQPPRPERRLRSSVDSVAPPPRLDNPKTSVKKKVSQNNVPNDKRNKKLDSVSKVGDSCDLNGASECTYPPVNEGENSCTPVERDPLSLPSEDEAGIVMRSRPPSIDCDVDPLDVSDQKKREGDSCDTWNETSNESAYQSEDKKYFKSKTPVIKISYGEGTVLKISAKPHNIPSECETDDKHEDPSKRFFNAKAAKRALKKAKKDARRKVVVASPVRSLGGTSPRYIPAVLSPRQNIDNSSPVPSLEKKHKHRVKHKKRHKEDRKHRDEKDDEMEDCLKQKLSISLKRLNANAYMRCKSSSPSHSEGSDEPSDAVPDFPSYSPMEKLSLEPINSCQTLDGRQMTVGDVVWGKVQGFPWWPGKVLEITENPSQESSSPQAHVSWYGSSTSSVMSCDHLNPFLETFQIRYNKKKRGPYREAIKQATSEARKGGAADVAGPNQVDVAS